MEQKITLQPIVTAIAKLVFEDRKDIDKLSGFHFCEHQSLNSFINEVLLDGLVGQGRCSKRNSGRKGKSLRKFHDQIVDTMTETFGPEKATFIADVVAGTHIDNDQYYDIAEAMRNNAEETE